MPQRIGQAAKKHKKQASHDKAQKAQKRIEQDGKKAEKN
jgi:hypothetical protein